MPLQESLERLRQVEYFALTKARYQAGDLRERHGDDIVGTPEYWLVPCSHTLAPPASRMELQQLAANLGQDLPSQLEELLRLANGAHLFCLRYRYEGYSDDIIAMYDILGCDELLAANREFLDVHMSYTDPDDPLTAVSRLNYIGFCDVGDGDYLGIVSEGVNAGSVFFLHHDYGYSPFGTEAAQEAYEIIARSLDEFLALLAETYGRAGLMRRLR